MPKKVLLYGLMTLTLTLTSYGAYADPAAPLASLSSLPTSIRLTMDQEYPGWKLAPVDPEVRKSLAAHHGKHSPSLVSGDFNGDGRRDYAVQIVFKQTEEEEQIVIIYLNKPEGFQEMIVQSQGLDPMIYLSVDKKKVDEAGANGQARSVERDVLLVLGSAIGDTTYAYQDGQFHELKSDADNLPPQTDVDNQN